MTIKDLIEFNYTVLQFAVKCSLHFLAIKTLLQFSFYHNLDFFTVKIFIAHLFQLKLGVD